MAESKKQNISIPFPVRGIQEAGSHTSQPPQSTPDAKNVVPFDSPEDRLRGGRRRGIEFVSGGSITPEGGKIQLLDDMKVPKSDYQGFAGGSIPYSGETDEVSIPVTSNLSQIVTDPNQDGDTSDSMDGQGPIAFRGPSNDSTLPIDMYESTYIWPIPGVYEDGTVTSNNDQPMSIQQIKPDDVRAGSPSSDPVHDGPLRRPVAMMIDGGPVHINNSFGGDTTGVWFSKNFDGLTGVIYPRPPYDTDGSDRSPGRHTMEVDQPNGELQGFYYGRGRNHSSTTKHNNMAGRHISTFLLPASASDDTPYNSIDNVNASWTMQASIKSPAKTIVPWGDTAIMDIDPSKPKVAITVGDYVSTVGTFAAQYTTTQPQVQSNGLTVYNSSGFATFLPFANASNFALKDMEVNRCAEVVCDRYYGFVVRVKAEVDTNGKTVNVSADTEEEETITDRILFVGFHDEPKPEDEKNQQCHKDPKLVIGQISNRTDGRTFEGVDSPLSHDGNIGLMDEAIADSSNNSNMPALLPGEWHDLQVRVHENTLTVYLDNIGPIKFTGGSIGSVPTSTVDLSAYLGASIDDGTHEGSRARSGLVYFSTRMISPERSNGMPMRLRAGAVTGTMISGWPSSGYTNWTVDTPVINPGFQSTTTNIDNDGYITLSYSYNLLDGNYGSITVKHVAEHRPGYDKKFVNYWTSYPGNNLIVNSTLDEMAINGNYCHNWGGGKIADGERPDKHMINRGGLGGDWVREWAPAYFHNVRWRSFTEQGAPGSNKLAISVSGGKIVVSGDDGASFSGLDDDTDGQGTFPTNTARVGGTVLFDRYYLADGSKYLVLNTPTRAIEDWSLLSTDGATDPTYHIPGGANSADTPKCSLICTWLGRIVMAGKADEANNWFMSAVSENDAYGEGVGPNDWDFSGSGDTDGGLQPIAGNSSNMPELGDPITALFPYHETNLVFGCSNSIYVLTNDPGPEETNATIQTISKDIGIVSPDAWCHGPNRALYFFGQNGLYQMSPNEFNVDQSNRLSAGRLDSTFSSIDSSLHYITMCYDYHTYGVHIFLHPRDQSSLGLTGTHYYYDERSDSLWTMEYPSEVGPSYAISYNNLDPDKRRILLGGYDGVIRHFSETAQQDTGTSHKPIDSYVWIGPIFVDDVTETKLMRIASVLDTAPVADPAAVTYEVYVGDTVEEARASTAVISGTWKTGRNPWRYTRARGQSIFVKISSSAVAAPWALETITATIAVAGRARDRSS